MKYVYVLQLAKGKYYLDITGGKYQKYKFTIEDKLMLKSVINNCNDKCYICGLKGHYPNMCHITLWIEDVNDEEENECIFF